MRKLGLWLSLALTLLPPAAARSAPQGRAGYRVRLVAGAPGSALEARDRLVAALPIINEGGGPAENVEVTGVSLPGAALIEPARLPLSLGTIRPNEQGTVFVTFGRAEFVPGRTYLLRAEGTYAAGGSRNKFAVERPLRLPPAAPDSAKAAESSSRPGVVRGARYTPQRPNFPDDVNERSAWTVAVGKFRAPGPRSKESTVERAPAGVPQEMSLFSDASFRPGSGALNDPDGAPPAPPPVNFFINAAAGIDGSSVNEPSGAAAAGVVFMTANWYAAYSTNNGGSFTRLDPTTIFPNNVDGGFCCDQIVEYVPRIDRFIWLMQYSRAGVGKPNRYRLAAASPAAVKSSGGTAWTYWDITSTQLGFGAGWVDYPDLAVGNNSLYVSFDDVGVGLTVVRIPLSEIGAGTTIHFFYTDPNKSPMAYGGHLTHNALDEIFWAGHNSNSSIRVFSWQEGSNTYFWRDVGIGSWPNNNANLTSTSPDGQDWLTKLRDFPVNAVLGSTRVTARGNQIWFAWGAPAGNNFRQPHVQWVALDRSNNFSLITQQQIWNSAYAFSYPALAVNSNGEVGLSLEFGGGGNYENHVVGFWGDFLVYLTTASNSGSTRFGDCVTIRQDANRPARFDAFGYGRVAAPPPAGGVRSDTHYVVFGR